MTSPAYRTCVARLEKLLSARVASRTLRMGMQQQGLEPDSATAETLDPVLKGPVFKQLQVAMPPDRAREAVKEILAAMGAAEAEATTPADDRAPPAAADPPGPAPEAPHAPAEAAAVGANPAAVERLESLRAALRPYNLYFEWPEVRRLRAQLGRLQEEIEAGGDGAALADEADAQLEVVAAKLEDRLVLQAQDLAELQEIWEEVQSLGGPKVRRLESRLKHLHEAQAARQLVDAEIERARKQARDLRKLMASSVFEEGDGARRGSGELAERLEALDREAERQDLDRLAREHAVLLEHRDDLVERFDAARARLDAGTSLGDGLERLREEAGRAAEVRRREVDDELTAAAATVEALPEEAAADLHDELEVLRAVLESGLPPLADLVRFRDRLALAREGAERADRQAEADAQRARAQLDAQAERLARARAELLRYGPEAEGPPLERLRTAVDRLRAAQAEERVDADAEAELTRAEAELAAATDDDASATPGADAVRVLLDRLNGLPAQLDPAGTAELRRELETWLERMPEEAAVASGTAAVADAIERARAEVSERLIRMGGEAAHWNLVDVLARIREANDRLEAGEDPALAELERYLDEAREEVRREQLERLHALERDAERLSGTDAEEEARLQDALARAREQVAGGEPARALAEAAALAGGLEATLERRIRDVMPRLDAALATFRTVERLNSDAVATVRRILAHLDAQRDAFARISPGMRARLERSLHEAEDLLVSLEEEERATRAIADQLMEGNLVDGLLGLFDGTPADGPAPAPAAAADPAEAWVRGRGERHGVTAAALLTRGRDAPLAADRLPAGRSDALPEVVDDLLGRLDALGEALGLGRARIVSLETRATAVVMGAAPSDGDASAVALLTSDDAAAVPLLTRDLRHEREWTRAAAEAARGRAD